MPAFCTISDLYIRFNHMVFKKTAVPSFTVTRMKMCIDLPNLTQKKKKIAQHNKTTSPLIFELKCAFLRSSLL